MSAPSLNGLGSQLSSAGTPARANRASRWASTRRRADANADVMVRLLKELGHG